MKKICLLSSIYIVIFIAFTGCAQKSVTENNFTKWVNDSKPISALKDYVQTVTDEKSKDFIPAKDRIAVFDLDGTLYCETFPIYGEWILFSDYVLNSPD